MVNKIFKCKALTLFPFLLVVMLITITSYASASEEHEVNIARGLPVGNYTLVGSATPHSVNTPDRAFNGNYIQFFENMGTSPWTLQVDFGEVKPVDKLRVYESLRTKAGEHESLRIRDYAIKYSLDGVNFTEVVSGTRNDSLEDESNMEGSRPYPQVWFPIEHELERVYARFVRLVLTGTRDTNSPARPPRITEFEIFTDTRYSAADDPANSSSLVYLSEGGLVYKPYANQGETLKVNTIPDFSHAGYKGGGIPIPNIDAKITISPIPGDNLQHIQNAINYVSGLTPDASGVKGAVYLNHGTYEIAGALKIMDSGVVLRGAGQGKDGSILKQIAGTRTNFIEAGQRDPDTLVAAQDYDGYSGNVSVQNGVVASIQNGDFLRYNDFDFHGVESFYLNYAAASGAEVELYVDAISPENYLGVIPLSPTANLATFRLAGSRVKSTAGNRDLYLRFKGTGSGELVRLESIRTSKPWTEVPNTRQPITTAYVPTGASTLDVANASGFAPGDPIIVMWTPNWDWVNGIDMAGEAGWTPETYNIPFERTVAGIEGNTIRLDVPIVQPITAANGGGVVYKYQRGAGHIQQVGIEDLRFESVYASDTDSNHGWIAIQLENVRDAWVRRITSQYAGWSAVSLMGEVTRTTVEDSAFLDPKSPVEGGIRYAFYIAGNSSQNLFQRNYAADARHAYITGSRVPGPNVFLHSKGVNSLNDLGPHHRYTTGLLIDNISNEGNRTRVWDRTTNNITSEHGWTGAQVVLWNLKDTGDITVESPVGGKNFAIGALAGSGFNPGSAHAGTGYFEFKDRADVSPQSLYLQQLKDRLGQGAVNAVTTAEQRNGTIIGQLEKWAGEGKLQSYDPNTHLLKAYANFYISDAEPDAVFAQNRVPIYEVQSSVAAGGNRRAFMKFHIEHKDLDSDIVRAVLRLRANEVEASVGISVYGVRNHNTNWGEWTRTWNNTNTWLGTELASTLVDEPGIHEWDVTTYVKQRLEQPSPSDIPFALYEPNKRDIYVQFSSRHGSFAPQLILYYD